MKRNSISKQLFITVWLSAIALAISMLCSWLFLDAQKTISWLDVADTNIKIEMSTDENGNQISVGLISSPQQLAGIFVENNGAVYADEEDDLKNFFGQSSVKTFKITQNLDLSGYSWTSPDLKSGYVIDGQGFVISGLSINSSNNIAGFVGTCKGTIKNLTINVSLKYATDINAYCGGIAGILDGGTIDSCTVTGSVTGSNSANERLVGGIVGKQNSGTITKCTNRATITNGSHVGGIVGYAVGGKVELNYNYVSVSTTSTGYVRIGGIVGEAANSVSVKYCYNEGSVYGVDTKGTANTAVGGIVGYCYAPVEQCYNKGSVSGGFVSYYGWNIAQSSECFTGGICGITSSTIKECGNTGAILAGTKQTTGEKSNVTTISSKKQFADNVGWLWAYDLYIVSGTYTDSGGSGRYKTSTYTSQKWETYYKNYLGGIVGSSSSSITNCFNTGSVQVILGSHSGSYQKYTLYFKWKANREHHLLITQNYSWQKDFYIGHIAGKYSSMSGCFYSGDAISYTRTITVNQELRNGDKTKTQSISDWVKNKEDSSWWLNSLDNADFNTYHNINAKDVSKIVLSCHYDGNVERSEKTYYTLYTGLSSKTWTESNATANKTPSDSNLNNNWIQKPHINGGKPILKCFYWV